MEEFESREQAARWRFCQGCNCAQAVLAPFASELGLDEETALRIASSFGGGVGRLREVCGAFSGLCMVLGLACNQGSQETPEQKAAHYQLIQDMAARFREVHGSIICREILKLKEDAPTPATPEARTPRYYSARPCERCVGTAAALCEEYLAQRKR